MTAGTGKIFHTEEGGAGHKDPTENGPGMPPNEDPKSWSTGLSMQKVNDVANMWGCTMPSEDMEKPSNCPVNATMDGTLANPVRLASLPSHDYLLSLGVGSHLPRLSSLALTFAALSRTFARLHLALTSRLPLRARSHCAALFASRLTVPHLQGVEPEFCDKIIANDAIAKMRLLAANTAMTAQPFFLAVVSAQVQQLSVASRASLTDCLC